MKVLNIYTSGATKNIKKEYSYGWRSDARNLLGEFAYTFIPEEYYDYLSKKPGTDKECYRYFMWRLKDSDILLVNLDDSDKSVGTGFEIQKALDLNIPIVGFGSKNIYSWVSDACDVTFKTLEDATEYIKCYYN